MNPFTTHTQQQGVTYREHLIFAMGIAFRLAHSVIAFALHALLPFISIDSRLDLEATSHFLQEQNHWIETAKDRRQAKTERGEIPSTFAHV